MEVSNTVNSTYMKRAFALAGRGMGKTAPNPMVGAVLVKKGRIIGEGWHRYYGGLHAEAEAVQAALAAGLSPAGADLYCTLEPCCFDAPGKHQPPCTTLIIKNKIKRVYIANLDPNPRVSGKGITILEKAGITVVSGLCAEAGEELNRAFFTFHRAGRPFVHLKMAQTLDGRIAAPNGSARWISDEAARRMVHRLRSEYDAVLIGRGTALADDPELTVRLVKGRNPRRVILDSRLAIPETAKLFSLPDPEKTIIVHSHNANPRKAANLHSLGVELIPIISRQGAEAQRTQRGRKVGGGVLRNNAAIYLPSSSAFSASPRLCESSSQALPLQEVLAALGERGIQSILVEGGAGIFASFLREGLWDRLSIIIAPIMLGGGLNAVSGLGIDSMDQVLRFKNGVFRRIGSQIMFEARSL
ncbi:MAG: bifunctional diaminohydroxyphosphoribosylaminopyrimidine deaminase/5-amino-6-(5-phosphoribosylamino)uracil reductase RibD [Treponema sp.]|nr:bifunctional diaminohydroxyphosphoribosylaminopyrimidine deaminase/5-amino-6-(5-phosphoribosylamino)uracil reductase RibD [Treponema sp.]